MTFSDWLGLLGLASGLVSIILAVVAIWLAIHFYNQAKGSEIAVATALADIRAQTSTLERIAGRQLDRLTKYATQSKPEDPQLAEFLITFRQFTQTALAPAIPAQGGASSAILGTEHLLSIYNVMYFAALANIGWNRQLLPGNQRPADQEPMALLVDESHQFFYAHLHILDSHRPDALQRAGILEGLASIRNELIPLLRTSHTVEP